MVSRRLHADDTVSPLENVRCGAGNECTRTAHSGLIRYRNGTNTLNPIIASCYECVGAQARFCHVPKCDGYDTVRPRERRL